MARKCSVNWEAQLTVGSVGFPTQSAPRMRGAQLKVINMSNEIALNNGNFAELAKAMGMQTATADKKASTLARFRIWHSPIMGEVEVKGKKKKMEVVEGGMYRLEQDGNMVYAPTVIFRPFLQRFMYKRYLSAEKTYHKTVMANDLNGDLKDNNGGFNCGKPAGYIEDFNALSENMKKLIREIKRVRVVFGIVELQDAVNANGEHVDVAPTPVIWEIDNKDAYKSMGAVFTAMSKLRSLPPQHKITLTTEERELPNGSSFFLPVEELDRTQLPLDGSDEETFRSFLEWIDSYNEYIDNQFMEKHVQQATSDDAELVDDFIDVEIGE